MKLGRQDLIPFIKFGVIGVFNTLCHSSIVIGLHERLGVTPVLAHLVAFEFTNILSYFLNSYLVFSAKPGFRRYLRFLAVSLFSLVTTLLIAAICEATGIDYRIGLVFVIILTPPVTYVLQKAFAFRERQ